MSKFVKTADAVSDDRNWQALIRNELKCAEMWDKDWGFLAADQELKKENATKLYTIDDKIKSVNEELEKLNNIKINTKESMSYGGRTAKIEIFGTNQNNITQNKDLMPVDRKLPKAWKKEKWVPPKEDGKKQQEHKQIKKK